MLDLISRSEGVNETGPLKIVREFGEWIRKRKDPRRGKMDEKPRKQEENKYNNP
jgi:hypothetical protein